MIHRESDSRVSGRGWSPTRAPGGYCLVRAIVAVVFLLIAAGITTAEWLAFNNEVATLTSASQRN